MFDGNDYPHPLKEEVFEEWLEKGRASKIGYHYLLIVWDSFEVQYFPVYTEERDKFSEYEHYGETVNQESLVAIYDLYSEARISLPS